MRNCDDLPLKTTAVRLTQCCQPQVYAGLGGPHMKLYNTPTYSLRSAALEDAVQQTEDTVIMRRPTSPHPSLVTFNHSLYSTGACALPRPTEGCSLRLLPLLERAALGAPKSLNLPHSQAALMSNNNGASGSPTKHISFIPLDGLYSYVGVLFNSPTPSH